MDNSISALLQPANLRRLQQSAGGWTPRIWIEFDDDTDDAKAAFIIQDNGVRHFDTCSAIPILPAADCSLACPMPNSGWHAKRHCAHLPAHEPKLVTRHPSTPSQ